MSCARVDTFFSQVHCAAVGASFEHVFAFQASVLRSLSASFLFSLSLRLCYTYRHIWAVRRPTESRNRPPSSSCAKPRLSALFHHDYLRYGLSRASTHNHRSSVLYPQSAEKCPTVPPHPPCPYSQHAKLGARAIHSEPRYNVPVISNTNIPFLPPRFTCPRTRPPILVRTHSTTTSSSSYISDLFPPPAAASSHSPSASHNTIQHNMIQHNIIQYNTK